MSPLNLNQGNSGRRRHARTEENIASADERIQENASRKVRKVAIEVGNSRESIWSILKKDLNLKHYRTPTLLIKCMVYTSLKMLITVILVL